MIYSKSCEYAIRALIYLAVQPEGNPVTIKEIAKEQKIPAHFLGKLLQLLAKCRLVKSFKGPHGGWMLAMPAKEIALIKVVECIDGLAYLERCAFGFDKCSESNPCPIHNSWKKIKEQIVELLETQTIAELSTITPSATRQSRDSARVNG